MQSPTRRVKLVLWLLLGLFSTAIPEVVSGSAPFVLFTPWGLLVTLPLYLLHAVFLAGLVYRYAEDLRFDSLYLAGVLFGLYEAYLTKVLWAPPWDPIPVRFGGLYVFETVTLLFLWHTILAFVVPLLVVETLCTRSRFVSRGLPRRIRTRTSRRPVIATGLGVAILGLVQGALVAPETTALASAAATSVALGLSLVAWRRWVGADRYTLDDLLPTTRELRVLGGLLVVLYVALGASLRPEQLPGLTSQATVWVLYLGVGSLLLHRLRGDRLRTPTDVDGRTVPVKVFFRNAAIYVVSVAIAGLVLRPPASAVTAAIFLTAIIVGGAVSLRLLRGFHRPIVRRP